MKLPHHVLVREEDVKRLWLGGEQLMRLGHENLAVSCLALALRFAAESGFKISEVPENVVDLELERLTRG